MISASGLAIAAALVLSAQPASAANIILNNLGGVEQGTAAYTDFQAAASFWGSLISTNVTVRLDVGFQSLTGNTLGETSTSANVYSISSVEHQLSVLGTSSVDALADAHLPALTSGALTVTTPGYTSGTSGIDTTKTVVDSDGSANNRFINVETANAKALGLLADDGHSSDGTIIFNSNFAFDFNASNGVAGNQIDFLGVTLHEIGHALGFDSGVDSYDLLGGPNGADANMTCAGGVLCKNLNANNFSVGDTLDLFRYSAANTLTWAPGVASYFSIDGGATDLCNFSTGAFNGDGYQASHWKHDGGPGGSPCGIMDPATGFGQQDFVSSLDFTALDAVGYNLTFDPMLSPATFMTGAIYSRFAVPEPSTWALMILGFGGVGATLRRRRRARALAAA